MKLGIITSGFFFGMALMGCSNTHQTAKVEAPHSVTITAPKDAHLAWCKGDPQGCFEAAGAMCSSDSDVGGAVLQHPRPGPWHQVPEGDMAFPAMVQDRDGWRMLFVCGSEDR